MPWRYRRGDCARRALERRGGGELGEDGDGWAPTGVSAAPVIDDAARPYVFDHVVPNQYASALAIFSAGTSHTWLRDILGLDYAEMDAAASAAGVGCGLWPGFDVVERVSSISDEARPDPAAHAAYEALYARFRSLAGHLGAWAMEGVLSE